MGWGIKDNRGLQHVHLGKSKEYIKYCEKITEDYLEKKAEKNRWEKAMRSIINL